MIRDILDALGLAAGIVDHALNHKQRARDSEAKSADLLLRKEAWDRYITAGGEGIVNYTRPSIKGTKSTDSSNRLADAFDRAFACAAPHSNKNFFKGNAETGYEVEASSVEQYNKALRAQMRAEKRLAVAAAKQAEVEENNRRQRAEAEKKRLEAIEASLECDSPAETDFLRAIIETYKMSFSEGAFRGCGVTVRKQVEIGRFRVDFLFNEELIVEIDGHEFHSGRDNANRDARRDEMLRAKGYRLLRIPAYRVHHNPRAAASDVNDFLKIVRSSKPRT